MYIKYPKSLNSSVYLIIIQRVKMSAIFCRQDMKNLVVRWRFVTDPHEKGFRLFFLSHTILLYNNSIIIV